MEAEVIASDRLIAYYFLPLCNLSVSQCRLLFEFFVCEKITSVTMVMVFSNISEINIQIVLTNYIKCLLTKKSIINTLWEPED